MKILKAAIKLEVMKNDTKEFESLKIHTLFNFKGIKPVLKFESAEKRRQFSDELKALRSYMVQTPPVISDLNTIALDPNATYTPGYTKHTDVLASKPPFKEGGIMDLTLVTDILYVTHNEEVYSLTEILSSIEI